jgi:ribose-phosphate pyrophosphokinase
VRPVREKVKLFFTTSTQHLALSIDGEKGTYVSKTFSDGERYVRIEEAVRGAAWVIANTNPPAENILELLFLLDALRRQRAEINLFIPYFAYARQDRITRKVISDLLLYFKPRRIVVFHMHSRRIRRYLDYEDLLPLQLVSPLAIGTDALVAPDRGGVPFAKTVGRECGLPVILIEKKRITDRMVEVMEISGRVKGKRVMIVDDMIATGGTIIRATEKLLSEGAREVEVYATHGIFSGDAREVLEKSPIKRIHVTNSLPQREGGKIKVLDISDLIRDAIKGV